MRLSGQTVLKLSFDNGPEISLSEEVLAHFRRHRQQRWFSREAGGQLFAEVDLHCWRIVKATGPRADDWRSRFSFRPNAAADQKEILDQFAAGLHYVGDWHTHPEARPTPSGTDLESIAQSAVQSVHQLKGFLLVVVGTNDPTESLWVSLHSVNGEQLLPIR